MMAASAERLFYLAADVSFLAVSFLTIIVTVYMCNLILKMKVGMLRTFIFVSCFLAISTLLLARAYYDFQLDAILLTRRIKSKMERMKTGEPWNIDPMSILGLEKAGDVDSIYSLKRSTNVN